MKALTASAARRIAEREPVAADAAAKAQAAGERLARIEQDEVGTIGRPLTRKDVIAAIGWKPSDFRHAYRLVDIEALGAHDELMAEIIRRNREAEKAASRTVLARRRHRASAE